VAYTFIAVDAIGEEIEEPFGTAPNDLALESLGETIEESLLEMAGWAPEFAGYKPEPLSKGVSQA
jgi:ion channel-forming bestrophin family protein